MEHLGFILTGFCGGVFSMLIMLKTMRILNTQWCILSLPLVTLATCIVLIKIVKDKEI